MNVAPDPSEPAAQPSAPLPPRSGEVLARLRAHGPGPVHIIDPFKVPLAEAVEKAAALTRLDVAAIILASTDYESFEERMAPYVAALKEVTPLPLLLHFPPRKGIGFPLVPGADAAMMPALLGSRDDYFVWKSCLETLVTLPGRVHRGQWPELLLTAALTFGEDRRTGDLLGTVPVPTASAAQLDHHVAVSRDFGFHLVYLYSRNAIVPADVVRRFRDGLAPGQILFVSGNVRTREQITAYIEAGADYVGFAGALEHTGWRRTLADMAGELARVATGAQS